jgi:predicted XRE-type DNA-binding protein
MPPKFGEAVTPPMMSQPIDPGAHNTSVRGAIALIDVALFFVVVWSAGIRHGRSFMRDREPTIRSRELGDGLRRAIEQAGLNGKQAAHLLGWSPSWVSRLLSGKRSATEVDVAAILGVCRVKGKERDRLLALCQEQNTPGWSSSTARGCPNSS